MGSARSLVGGRVRGWRECAVLCRATGILPCELQVHCLPVIYFRCSQLTAPHPHAPLCG